LVKAGKARCFQLTGLGPLSSKPKFLCLHWAGNVNRMPKHGIPHIMLHGVMSEGARQTLSKV